MKKFLILTTMFVALVVVGFGQTITGTMHDFNNTTGDGSIVDATWNTSSDNEKCGTCHIPHNADAVTVGAPLWSHDISSAGFTSYTGTDMDATTGAPSGTSLLCLSCHDGTVDLDAHDQKAGVATVLKMTGSALVGTDLSNDHPVSFTWVNEAGLHDPTATLSGLGANIDDDMLFGAGNDQMECASCHDAHNDANGSFLRKSNANSALCLTCHNK
mgnify:CR=1 FL=1